MASSALPLDAHSPSQPNSAQNSTLPQAPIPFTGIPSFTITIPPQALAPNLASSTQLLKDPLVQVAPVPVSSMAGITTTTPPASVQVSGMPLDDLLDPPVLSAGEIEQRSSKKGKMCPGSSLTAWYVCSLTHYWLLTLIYLFRNLCVIDWCMKYPDGTAAEFKQYYDHEMSNKDKKVRLHLICSNFKECKLIFSPRPMNSDRKKPKRR